MDIYILYIAINISRITVDKYSGLLTIRSPLLPFIQWVPKPPKGPTCEEEEETLIVSLFHPIKM